MKREQTSRSYVIECILSLFIGLHPLCTQATTLAFAQTSLKQLTQKITHLQHKLMDDRSQRKTLQQQLTQVETQISNNQHQLLALEHDIDQKKSDIIMLRKDIAQEQEKITQRQQLLSQQIRARYTQHNTTSWGWLLQQEQIRKMNRYLTYYQYIIKAQQHLLDDIQTKQQHLQEHEHELAKDLAAQDQLQQNYHNQQQHLMNAKIKQQTLLQTLNQNISVKKQKLAQYQQNQINLSHLMHSLVQKSVIQTRHSFTNMHGKLPHPLRSPSVPIKPFHQGLLFFAPEGTNVHAVYPGKIVFSDWLNGYGLLMIIDHGWGFMTLYSNNKSLLKHVGQTVDQYEIISLVGHTGGLQKDSLYFEIRHHGKTVPPRHWLS